MKAVFFKVICVSILLGTSVWAKSAKAPCPPPSSPPCCPETPCCPPTYPDQGLSSSCPSAYNISAKIDTCSSHFFGDVSFIYWYISQTYMDIGRSAVFHADGATPAPNASVIGQHFNYEPGFQLGLGYTSNYDGWEVQAQYTYLHHENSFQAGSVPTAMIDGQKIWIPNEWFLNLSTDTQQQAVRMDSKWKMHLDLLDVYVSRPFYQGIQLIVKPYAGIRTLWLRENFTVKAFLATALTAPPAISLNRSRAWSIGPLLGADLNWLLGKGFRAETDMGFSLLYMHYSDLVHQESFDSTITETIPLSGHLSSHSSLQPIAQARLGVGWGTYLSCNRFHLDFSASYDFMLLWEQNKPRETVGYFANNEVGYSNPIGDLSLHGLTLNGRFDF